MFWHVFHGVLALCCFLVAAVANLTDEPWEWFAFLCLFNLGMMLWWRDQ